GDLVSALRDLQQQDALAPDAFSFRTHRCFTMMDFGAVEAADACMRPLIARAPDAAAVLGAQARLAYLRGDLPSARAFLQRIPEEGGAVMDGSLAQRLGDVAPMLALSRKRRPHWFDTPPGTVSSTQAFSAMETGLALLRCGDGGGGQSPVRRGQWRPQLDRSGRARIPGRARCGAAGVETRRGRQLLPVARRPRAGFLPRRPAQGSSLRARPRPRARKGGRAGRSGAEGRTSLTGLPSKHEKQKTRP